MTLLQVSSRHAARAVFVAAIIACGRSTQARDRGAALPPCPAGSLDVPQVLRHNLDERACTASAGNHYADFSVHLLDEHAYLIRVTDAPDSIGRPSRHREFDATLLDTGAAAPAPLHSTAFDGRDPARTISQLFFIAPATGTYMVRVQGHGPRDLGAFAVQAQACGGGTLTVGHTAASSLGDGSCLEQMSFGADSGYADLWRIHLASDQRVTIGLLSDGRGPMYLHIRGPGLAGEEQGGDVNRLRFTARLGGDYTVLVGQLDFDPAPHPYAIRVSATPR